MHVRVSRCETRQNFNIWVYADEKLVRGSGLFVGENGVSGNHHFLAPKDSGTFRFIEGSYLIEVFATLLGDISPLQLWSQTFEISREQAAALQGTKAGLYFDWGPDSGRYIPHIEERQPSPEFDDLLKVLGLGAQLDIRRREKT